MKVSNIILSALLVLLCTSAWVIHILNDGQESKMISSNLAQASEYTERGLYQKALKCYDNAISIGKSKEYFGDYYQCADMALKDGAISKNQYIEILTAICAADPKNEQFWVLLVEGYRDMGRFSDANHEIKKAFKAGADGERLRQLQTEIAYSFSLSAYSYIDVIGSPNGYSAAYDGEKWGQMSDFEDGYIKCVYSYVSPPNLGGTALYVEEDSRIVDLDGMVESILPYKVTKAYAYGDGMLPIQTESGWNMIDCESGAAMAEYDLASSYTDGIAAVKSGNTWYLVDLSGQKVYEEEYEDVVLQENGLHIYDDVMIAKQNGEYGVYNHEGERQASLPGVAADRYLGELIAFKDSSGLWGYASKNGDIVISPCYTKAKSFSNGFAPVYDGEKWGFINKDNQLVIPYQFSDVKDFSNKGTCMVATFPEAYQLLKLRFQ